MMERKSRLSAFFKQCVITTAALLNNVVHGSGLAYAAVLLPQLRHSSIRLGEEQESWLASIIPLAMCAGNVLTVPAMRRGRRATHLLVSLLNIAGWLTITLACNFQVLMIGRFLQGMSIGLFIPVVSVYLGEYTSPSHRGVFLATISFGQALGTLFGHSVGSFLAWQDMALLCSGLSLISFAITVFTPESPSWLALEGRFGECRKAFRWLRGDNEEEELNKMIQERQHFDSSDDYSTSILEALQAMTKREIYIPLAIGVAMYVIIVNCGSLILANYVNEIVEELMGPSNVVAWMCVFDGVRLASNLASLYIVARVQRRTLLFSTGIACVFVHIALSAYIYAQLSGIVDGSWIPALILICQIVTIGLGVQSICFMILGEIFPLQYRGLCSSVCGLMMGLMFVELKTFPALRGGVGLGGAWLVYGAAVGLALMVTWPLLPETRGRTLQDIEGHFRKTLRKGPEAEAMNTVTSTK
ncbi:facilitated trehalose transporter Tret1-like [Cydia pomonella]|uniref:facilitated trehalose transporter Tret1-like n=1 Tax=Cydia pomonella TaxID=82600 RepID=UPI002ADDEC70|nr:facilitated trehalose transporter Tret1-like [Cydia pomonella]